MHKYDKIREHALANFELLLIFWGIEFNRINTYEYDLIAKWREDGNFGAVRFNTFKGRGSDFAGINLAAYNFEVIGEGFSREDFAGFTTTENTNTGFDIIGLCRKVYNISDYRDAAARIISDLQEIAKRTHLTVPAHDAAEKRAEQLAIRTRKHIEWAQKAWGYCKKIKFEGSPADIYLISRGLAECRIRENNLRYHPKVMNKEAGKIMPALLLKVSVGPLTELVAVHRIFLTQDGQKADLDNPKMALGAIKGAGIWFGTPNEKLAIAEGPENALTIRVLGAPFAVSTVYATNFANLTIPDYVTHVDLYPDPDPAGLTNTQKAIEAYKAQNKKVSVKLPPKKEYNGILMDWNDILQEAK